MSKCHFLKINPQKKRKKYSFKKTNFINIKIINKSILSIKDLELTVKIKEKSELKNITIKIHNKRFLHNRLKNATKYLPMTKSQDSNYHERLDIKKKLIS